MNGGGLNTHALNESVADAVVQAAVDGYAYAMGRISARVVRRSPQLTQGAATPSGSGRGLARSPVTQTGRALALVGVRALRRSVVAAQAQAVATLNVNWVRMRLQVAAQAGATVTARVLRRTPVALIATAQASVDGVRYARSVCAGLAQAQGVVSGIVWARHNIASPLSASAQAVASVVARVLRRDQDTRFATASETFSTRRLARQPLIATAQAVSYVGASSIVHYPFDENALEENTYVVPFENNLFYVVDGMTIVATVAQQPNDIKDHDIDFSEYFPAGDVVNAVELLVAPAGLVVGYALQHPRIKVWVRGGVSGTKYKVTILARTNDGRAKEVEMIVKIKDN